MSNISLNYAQIIDPLSFKSINLAKIYIGEYGTLPNPANASTWKQAYFVNSDGTRTAASQPIRTNEAGFAVDGSGNIKTIQVDGGYSLLAQDQLGATKFSTAKAADIWADLSGSGGSSLVGFKLSATGAALRTVFAKLSGYSATPEDFGAVGDGVANDQAAFEAAKTAGVKELLLRGNYLVNGVTFTTSDSVSVLRFENRARLTMINGAGGTGLSIQKQVFRIDGVCDVRTSGGAASTVGVAIGTPSTGQAYVEIDAIRHEGFTARGLVAYAPVYLSVDRVDGYSSGYGISLEKIGSVGATAVKIGRSYQTGALRGINADGAAWLDIGTCITEYCGSDTSNDGAIHLNACARTVIRNRYGEQNKRNIVRIDSPVFFDSGAMFAATAPDIVQYSAIPSSERGSVEIDGNSVFASVLKPPRLESGSLSIGSDISVPASGATVIAGISTTKTTITATSGTWTTIATVSGQSGGGQTRKSYRYAVYAGQSDLTTGYDSGSVLNGVIRSDSGSLPAWLRISGNDIQVNVTSSSYGLACAISLTETGALG